jgi:hypothetical protein
MQGTHLVAEVPAEPAPQVLGQQIGDAVGDVRPGERDDVEALGAEQEQDCVLQKGEKKVEQGLRQGTCGESAGAEGEGRGRGARRRSRGSILFFFHVMYDAK